VAAGHSLAGYYFACPVHASLIALHPNGEKAAIRLYHSQKGSDCFNQGLFAALGLL
jgi:hypothetical protein